jgi:Rieske Fe-S protein
MSNEQKGITTRRGFLSSMLMWGTLVVSYGVLGVEGLLFLLPEQLQPKRRLLFAGSVDQYDVGSVAGFHDLQGNEILVKRNPADFQAFSTVCPHLGCRVRWEAENSQFFCPCHRGVFDENGVAVSGPPKDGGQNLIEVPVTVDNESGVVYLEVKDAEKNQEQRG